MSAPALNVLFIVADQVAPQSLPCYGHPLVRAPNIDALAGDGVVLDNAYTNSPLCVPARASIFTGRLSSRLGVFDSGAELLASTPTLGHYLRLMGYHTCLSGKCHFVGPDQLHGFEERLTTDICPADFSWTGDWDRGEASLAWYHTLENVVTAGVAERATQQDHDEDACHRAVQWLYDWARQTDRRPFFLQVSFSQPHDPYVTPQRYWDRYDHATIDLPAVPYVAPHKRDPYSAWLYRHYDRGEFEIGEAEIRNARHGYYGNIGYVDDLAGAVLSALERIRQDDRTLVVLTSDHGDMLGERGQWYKMSPFERSARVPLIVRAPGLRGGGRVSANVSLVDLMPSILDLASEGRGTDLAAPVDGNSFSGLLRGNDAAWPDVAVSEFLFEGLTEPAVMVRKGRYKYVHCNRDAALLFDIENDPHERTDLSGDAGHAAVRADLEQEVARRWDFDALTEEILLSQRRRNLIRRAGRVGRAPVWDHQPFTDAASQYYRGSGNWHEKEATDVLRF